MEPTVNATQGHPSLLAVIKTMVNRLNGRVPLEALGVDKIHPVLGKVGDPLVFVPFVLHV